jgi:hypothetical protein
MQVEYTAYPVLLNTCKTKQSTLAFNIGAYLFKFDSTPSNYRFITLAVLESRDVLIATRHDDPQLRNPKSNLIRSAPCELSINNNYFRPDSAAHKSTARFDTWTSQSC